MVTHADRVTQFTDTVISSLESETWIDVRPYASDPEGLIESLSGAEKTIWVTEDIIFDEALAVGAYDGITLLVKKGHTVTFAYDAEYSFNISVESGGQLLIDENCTINGNLNFESNNKNSLELVTGDESITFNGGNKSFYLSSFESFSDAILAMNALGKSLIIDQPVDLGGGTVDCLGVGLVWLSEGNVISNGTLQNCSLSSSALPIQILDTDITLSGVITHPVAYAEWFGELTSITFQKVIDTFNIIKVSTDINISSPVAFKSNINVDFQGNSVVVSNNYTHDSVFINTNTIAGNEKIILKNLEFNMNVDNQTTYSSCVLFENVNNSRLENILIPESKYDGTYKSIGAIHVIGNNNQFYDIELENFGDEGLNLFGENNHVMGGKYSNGVNGSGIGTHGFGNIVENVIANGNAGSNISIDGTYNKLLNVYCTGGNGITLGHPDNPATGSIVDGCVLTDLTGDYSIGIFYISEDVIIKNTTIRNSIGTNYGIRAGINAKGLKVDKCNISGHVVGFRMAASNSKLSNSKISGATNYGLDLDNVQGCKVSFCEITAISRGVNVKSNSSLNKFTNVDSIDAGGNQSNGFYLEGTKNTFANCSSYGNSTVDVYSPLASNNIFLNNIWSGTDKLIIEVTLSTGTTTIINNENIKAHSFIIITPRSVAAASLNVNVNTLSNGTVTLGHSTANGETVQIQIIS